MPKYAFEHDEKQEKHIHENVPITFCDAIVYQIYIFLLFLYISYVVYNQHAFS